MKQVIKAMVGVALILSVSGCAPDEKDLCDHMMTTMKDDPEKPRFLEGMDKCLERMEKVKKRAGVNSYRREATCAHEADTSYKMRRCIQEAERKRAGGKF